MKTVSGRNVAANGRIRSLNQIQIDETSMGANIWMNLSRGYNQLRRSSQDPEKKGDVG